MGLWSKEGCHVGGEGDFKLQPRPGDGVEEGQAVGVEGRAGDEVGRLGAVEEVPVSG